MLLEREFRSGARTPSHNRVTMHANFTETGRLKLWTRWDWDYWARTMYKRKDKKVHPRNVALPDGIKPGGKVAGELETMTGELEIGDSKLRVNSGLKVPHGSRLTPARLERMKIGVGFLSGPERKLFIDILYEFEGVIAFEDNEMGLVKPEIEPPVVIHTVPHKPWQQNNIRLLKATQDAATAI